MQGAGHELEEALLAPLGRRALLHHGRAEALLAHLDHGVGVARAVLALGPQSPGPQHRHLHVRGHPPLAALRRLRVRRRHGQRVARGRRKRDENNEAQRAAELRRRSGCGGCGF
ncbi:hypothetical protein Z043_115794 [Scleropages formosus]|uniref:Uncharacterized protein n=1 Tax=Scleropages formosus TaxID=113540 RepID=A0A0P7TWR4_SCLFO|nr:hypothetical protein Z043_115794 [Scleropages formosus]